MTTSNTLMQGFPPAAADRVTPANWLTPACVKWGFQHVRELMPTAEVSRGAGGVSGFDYRLRDLDAIAFTSLAGDGLTIHDMLRRSQTDGFLVLKSGEIVTEYYANNLRPDSKHLLQSVTKSVIGSLAGVMVEAGAVDPDAAVAHYVPALAHSGYADATVRQVMDMTTSIVYTEDYDDPASSVTRHEASMGWRPRHGVLGDVPDSQYEFLPLLAKHHVHGRIFAYKSADADVLGWVLESATGVRVADLLGRYIWSRLGAEHDAYITVDAGGSAAASGGLNVTLRDLGRFAQMHLQNGYFNGAQTVPEKFIRDSRYPGLKPTWKRSERFHNAPHGAYRNQWWSYGPSEIIGNRHDIMVASGIHGQHVWIIPDLDVVMVKLSSQPQAENNALWIETFRGFAAVASALA